MSTKSAVAVPLRGVGGYFAMALDTILLIPQRPFAFREFVVQAWFLARICLVPTTMVAIPFSVLAVFSFNILLIEFGAADYSGTGTSLTSERRT